MNQQFPDPENESTSQDESGWSTVPSDYNDVVVKGDTPDIGESLGD